MQVFGGLCTSQMPISMSNFDLWLDVDEALPSLSVRGRGRIVYMLEPVTEDQRSSWICNSQQALPSVECRVDLPRQLGADAVDPGDILRCGTFEPAQPAKSRQQVLAPFWPNAGNFLQP